VEGDQPAQGDSFDQLAQLLDRQKKPKPAPA
jgi:hypothetical protein